MSEDFSRSPYGVGSPCGFDQSASAEHPAAGYGDRMGVIASFGAQGSPDQYASSYDAEGQWPAYAAHGPASPGSPYAALASSRDAEPSSPSQPPQKNKRQRISPDARGGIDHGRRGSPARTPRTAAAAPMDSPEANGEIADGEEGASDNVADAKREKRLVKNRKAAQLFRKRQKQYIIDLEKQVSTLTSQNAAYNAKIELLSAENRLIKDQLSYLRGFISKSVQLSVTPAQLASFQPPGMPALCPPSAPSQPSPPPLLPVSLQSAQHPPPPPSSSIPPHPTLRHLSSSLLNYPPSSASSASSSSSSSPSSSTSHFSSTHHQQQTIYRQHQLHHQHSHHLSYDPPAPNRNN